MSLTLQHISKSAAALHEACFDESKRIRSALPDFDQAPHENERKRIVIAKKQVMGNGQLAGQIIEALKSGCLQLALLGLRSLTEEVINTKYIFAHPEHLKDLDHTYGVCRDAFERVDNDLQFNQLGGKSIKQRSRAVGLEEMYDQDFNSLSNYTHMTLRVGHLSEDAYFNEYSAHGFLSALAHLNDIQCYVREHFEISGGDQIESDIRVFQKDVDQFINLIKKPSL